MTREEPAWPGPGYRPQPGGQLVDAGPDYAAVMDDEDVAVTRS